MSQDQLKKVCFDARTPPHIHEKLLAMIRTAEKYYEENTVPKNEFVSIPLNSK